MATCQDCESPVVWLRKPDGSWLPPVEPVFDFAYGDHFTTSVDGTAQPVPQIYKRHECLSWEERQLKQLEREREKRALIEADRARRAEAERVQRELEEARQAQEEAERRLAEELERQERQRRARQAARRRQKEAQQERDRIAEHWFPKRLLPVPCRDCGAEADEPCRTDLWKTHARPHLWWLRAGHNARYADAPPDDRSAVSVPERWGEDYDPFGDAGTTPETCGPWPPSVRDPGRYDMVRWLRRHYIDVFEPKRRWLTDEEQRTLTEWLHQFGDLFEEVNDDPGRVAHQDARPGTEGPGERDAHPERTPAKRGGPFVRPRSATLKGTPMNEQNDQNNREDQADQPEAPLQQPIKQPLTLGGLVAIILVALAVVFFINANNAAQEMDRHQRDADCHLQRADALIDGDPNPPACP